VRSELLLSTAQAQWAVTAYLVPFGALLLVGGRLGDRYGRRRVLMAGLALFALGNLGAALSTGFADLVLARALTGIGAAAASPSALALLVTCFPSGPAHVRAFAAWGGVGAAGAAAGVLVGGCSPHGWAGGRSSRSQCRSQQCSWSRPHGCCPPPGRLNAAARTCLERC
jgi:MFS family permease